MCIDVPQRLFDAEVEFWGSLTGWERRPGNLDEFIYLARPPSMPIRLLVQRLGEEDPDTTARAHLDLACGPDIDGIVPIHEQLGAERIETRAQWTTLRDPAGLPYCLTTRDPTTGRLPS